MQARAERERDSAKGFAHKVDLKLEQPLPLGEVVRSRSCASWHYRIADCSLHALPGGFGTLEEFCEIITWAQLGLHRKPCAVLNAEGYYDPLLALFDHAVAEGFLAPPNRRLVLEGTDPNHLLDLLAGYTPPQVEKWIVNDES